MRAAVIAHGDAAPVLEAAEHIFDLVALPVERLAIRVLDLTVVSRRNTGGDTLADQGGTEAIAVIAAISEQCLCFWQGVKHQPGALVAAHLPFREQHHDRTTFAVTDSVQLGRQPAA